jgi:nucleoside 2-deoxyribosyltransferase
MDAPIKNPTAKPKIYVAGKISSGNFREDLIPEYSKSQWGDPFLETSSFIYLGPFTANDKHNCFTGEGTHNCVGDDGAREITEKQVIDTNLAAIEKADIFLAYINCLDCYGTICEIGVAIRAKKRVVICIAPGLPVNEFWFFTKIAAAAHFDINSCCLKNILNIEIANYGKN